MTGTAKARQCAESRAAYLAANVCPRCGAEDLVPGETLGPDCRAKGRQATRDYRARQVSARYCSKCLTTKPSKGFKTCKRCRKGAREYWHFRTAARRGGLAA